MDAFSPHGRWFFVSMAAVLLVVGGFARSFYLRNIFSAGHPSSVTLPFYIVLHGIVLTLWFLFFFAQAVLASCGHVGTHRRLGVAGAVLAAIVVPLSLLVVFRSVMRETALVVIGDIALLILFTTLISLGIWFRQRPEVHKRLMTIASITIVAPAIARWPGAQSMLPLSVVLPQLSLYAAQVVYDVRSLRRVHSATVWGVASYFVALAVTIPLASSNLGHSLVNALK